MKTGLINRLSLQYSYGNGNLARSNARVLALEFKNGKLNAFEYVSSFDEHQTHVSPDMVNQISSHVSTKTDVLKALGKPSGKALCPSTLEDFKDQCKKCVEIWAWQTATGVSTVGAAFAGNRPSFQDVYIGFDKDGVVSDVITTSSK